MSVLAGSGNHQSVILYRILQYIVKEMYLNDGRNFGKYEYISYDTIKLFE